MFVLPTMISLSGGVFLMGDPAGRADEKPVHEVRLDPFAIARAPVSVAEYALFLAARGLALPASPSHLPITAISWLEAQSYADWLSELTGRNFHLPTEAQREYSARGGRPQQAYPWGNDPLPLEARYARGLSGPLTGMPIPIGETALNDFGLLHIADNLHEWCSDWYDPAYYARSPRDNPTGPDEPTDRRAARGGSWRHDIKYARCAARSSLAPDKHFADFGFRLAESIP